MYYQYSNFEIDFVLVIDLFFHFYHNFVFNLELKISVRTLCHLKLKFDPRSLILLLSMLQRKYFRNISLGGITKYSYTGHHN